MKAIVQHKSDAGSPFRDLKPGSPTTAPASVLRGQQGVKLPQLTTRPLHLIPQGNKLKNKQQAVNILSHPVLSVCGGRHFGGVQWLKVYPAGAGLWWWLLLPHPACWCDFQKGRVTHQEAQLHTAVSACTEVQVTPMHPCSASSSAH